MPLTRIINERTRQPKSLIPLAIIGFFLILGIIILLSSFYSVETGKKALVKTGGKITDVQDEGFHLKIPFLNSIERVDIRTQKADQKADGASKDSQQVSATVSVNYHLNPNKLPEIYKRTGTDAETIENKIIDPRIANAVKEVTAKYSAEQLITQRNMAKANIDALLKNSLAPYDLIVEDVQLTQFEFGKEYNKAIEAKQTEVQNTLRAQNTLARIKIEAEQKITQAKAEAESIRIQSEAIRNQGGQDYVNLQWIQKWDGKMPQYVGSNAPMLMMTQSNTAQPSANGK